MQLPTHVIFGVLIQLFLFQLYSSNTVPFLVVVLITTFISHFVLDSLAIMTYHPPIRQQTNFWLYWHIFVYLSGAIFIIVSLVINPLLIVGVLGANLPDLWDWVLLRGILKSENKKLYIHKYANKIRSLFKDHVPDLSYSQTGIIPELCLMIIMYFYLIIRFIPV